MTRIPLTLVFWLLRFYQKYISPLKPPTCRFYPSCSTYAIEAFSRHGFWYGLCLSLWRLLRCQPFSAGGYDPVPMKKAKKKSGRSTNLKGRLP
ncbi:MAG: membrane protein insertion efficiency factor YidD [Deltaproteobacteria bacterium]|nr:membrane protein insertion efficiency factor YidD [Deltaproteobacteria bacterium]